MMKQKLCGGLGINDADYQVTKYIVGDNGKRKRVWVYPYYARWKSLMERIGPNSKEEAYFDKTCCADWVYFSKFKAWMEAQTWENLDLDKDILIQNNKEYGPTTCAFVPAWINTLLMTNTHRKGILPLGVHLSSKGQFRAQVSNVYTNKNKHLGLYQTPEEAHSAWQRGKIDQIEKALKMYEEEGCFRLDIKEALLKRSSNILEDNKNSRETLFL